jgi:putative AlgH/UPF0301 family transcriptional regulator
MAHSKTRVDIQFKSRGHFTISTRYFNRTISTVTTNTQAIDRYRDTESPKKAQIDAGGMTWKQAEAQLRNEILRNNKNKQHAY